MPLKPQKNHLPLSERRAKNKYLIVAVYADGNGRFADFYEAATPELAERAAHDAAESPLLIAGTFLVGHAYQNESYVMQLVG